VLPRLQCGSTRRLEGVLRLLRGSGDEEAQEQARQLSAALGSGDELPPLSSVGTLTLGNPNP